MTTYHVEVRIRQNTTYEVEARDAIEAEENAVLHGKPIAKWVEQTFDTTLPQTPQQGPQEAPAQAYPAAYGGTVAG